MRTTTKIAMTRTAAALVAAVALAGCGGSSGESYDAAANTATTSDAPESSAPESSGAESSAPESGAADAGSATDPGPPLTTVPAGVIALPQASAEGVVDWEQMGQCTLGRAQAASDMRSVRDGDGKFEKPVTVAQVVAFPDVDSAAAEAKRIGLALETCTLERLDTSVRYSFDDVAVGAQGKGLGYEYAEQDDGKYAFGSYLVVTRRGNAVALAARVGGEGSPDAARTDVTELAREAWSKLCEFDRTRGC